MASLPVAATIFADGAACSPPLLRRLRKDRFTVALDGAAEIARRQRWLPDLIAGDFDSASPATLAYFEKKGVPLLPTPDQNYTDLEKAVAWCILQGFESLWIAQGFGKRIDHSFAALSLLPRFHGGSRDIRLVQDKEQVRFLKDQKLRLSGKVGRRIAVLPFPRCRATSQGLAFEMHHMSLAVGRKESVSNQARVANVDLAIEGSALVVESF